ncbi:MAG: hypothetical protein WCK78_04370 [Paludibacter sp.]
MNTEKQEETNQIRVFTKKFDGVEQLLSEEHLKNSVANRLNYMSEYKKRPLREVGLNSATKIINEYLLIEQKKSNLSGSKRELVKSVIIPCIQSTLDAFSVVVEKGLVFSGKEFKGLVRITKLNISEKILNVECRKGKQTWSEVWDFDDTMTGFETGEYFKVKGVLL